MNVTNYDTSSTGVSCELCIMRDDDIAQSDFECAFHVHQHKGYRTTALYEYGGYSDRDPIDGILDVFDFSACTPKQFRNALWEDYCEEPAWTTPGDWMPTMRGFLEEYHTGFKIGWKDTFMETLEERISLDDWAKDGSECALIKHLRGDKPKFHVISSTGYSQGDYANVLVSVEDFPEPDDAFKQCIENLIWNQPVYARLEVDGEDYYLMENQPDAYEWDRDKIKVAIDGLDIPESAKEWAKDNLPEYL